VLSLFLKLAWFRAKRNARGTTPYAEVGSLSDDGGSVNRFCRFGWDRG
jgi:hypothetical protein